jgi:hypothetical protein
MPYIVDCKKVFKSINDQILMFSEAEKAEIYSRQRSRSNLVFPVDFLVKEVVTESKSSSPISKCDEMMGRISMGYRGGCLVSKLVLKVAPDDNTLPIRTLCFNGSSGVRAGDHIRALVPRLEAYRVMSEYGAIGAIVEGEDRSLYTDRAFKSEESAIELAILSRGKVVRTDRSVDYDQFNLS